MIVVSRVRRYTDADCPTEDIDIVGSTGNIYTITISHEPTCTCPDSKKGNECKHKVYALHTVLKAPDHLQYQLALLSTELREIFEHAPPIPSESKAASEGDGKRKPTDGECPICYFNLVSDEASEDGLVWCRAACGNNMHKSCFDQWAASQKGQALKCVYCRATWEVEAGDLEKIKKMGRVNGDGYVNVADHFGISDTRDYSTYHQPWVRRRFGGW
jgi:Ring finger domain